MNQDTDEEIIGRFLRQRYGSEGDSLANIEWRIERVNSNGFGSRIVRLFLQESETNLDEAAIVETDRQTCTGVAAGTTRIHQLLVKMPLRSNKRIYDLLNKVGVFEHEIFMYEKVLPRMNQIMRRPFVDQRDSRKLGKGRSSLKTSEDEPYFCARFWGTDQRQSIVVEDLCPRGYESIGFKDTLDVVRLTAVIRKIANFHAASVKFHQMNPGILDAIRPYDVMKHYINMVDRLRLALKSLPALVHRMPPDFATKLTQFESVYKDLVLRNWDPASDVHAFKVLNHGDLWQANLFFHQPEILRRVTTTTATSSTTEDDDYDDDDTVVKFIDFQLANWSSPANDLTFLFAVSTSFETFRRHGDRLLRLYIRTLHDTMAKLGCGGGTCGDYTVEQLKADMKKRFAYIIFVVSYYSPNNKGDGVHSTDEQHEQDTRNLTVKSYQEFAEPWLEYSLTEMCNSFA